MCTMYIWVAWERNPRFVKVKYGEKTFKKPWYRTFKFYVTNALGVNFVAGLQQKIPLAYCLR